MAMVMGFEERAPSAVTFGGERVNQKNIWAFLVVAVVVAAAALGHIGHGRRSDAPTVGQRPGHGIVVEVGWSRAHRGQTMTPRHGALRY